MCSSSATEFSLLATPHDAISDPDSWYRVGHGRTFEFYATDHDVERWLANSLPPEYEPYSLVGYDIAGRGRTARRLPFRCPITRFTECRTHTEMRTQFWIWSTVLTPDLPLIADSPIHSYCSLNGLVMLYHGSTDPDGRRRPSLLSVVGRVRNEQTGEERRHDGYLRIFQSLRTAISRDLVYATRRLRSGGLGAETDEIRMTEDAAKSHGNRVLFQASPGRRLERGRSAKRPR